MTLVELRPFKCRILETETMTLVGKLGITQLDRRSKPSTTSGTKAWQIEREGAAKIALQPLCKIQAPFKEDDRNNHSLHRR
jgi:hypothetical protein